VYEAFRAKFAFPKLGEHGAHRYLPPREFVMAEDLQPSLNLLQQRNLFTDYKRVVWTPVEEWLQGLGRRDLTEKAIAAFREDLGDRVPSQLGFLFE